MTPSDWKFQVYHNICQYDQWCHIQYVVQESQNTQEMLIYSKLR